MEERNKIEFTAIPGLYNQTGALAYAVGIFKPKVIYDPLIDVHPGGNAIMVHEAVHVLERHALRGIFVLIFTLGLGYLFFRRECELRADAEALRLMGEQEFRAMVYTFPDPVTRVGRFIYGKTREERIRRAHRRNQHVNSNTVQRIARSK